MRKRNIALSVFFKVWPFVIYIYIFKCVCALLFLSYACITFTIQTIYIYIYIYCRHMKHASKCMTIFSQAQVYPPVQIFDISIHSIVLWAILIYIFVFFCVCFSRSTHFVLHLSRAVLSSAILYPNDCIL